MICLKEFRFKIKSVIYYTWYSVIVVKPRRMSSYEIGLWCECPWFRAAFVLSVGILLIEQSNTGSYLLKSEVNKIITLPILFILQNPILNFKNHSLRKNF